MKIDEPAKLSIFAGACLFILIAVLKNVLRVNQETLMNEVLLYIMLYTGFGVASSAALKGKAGAISAKYWYAAVAIATLAIIGLHMI